MLIAIQAVITGRAGVDFYVTYPKTIWTLAVRVSCAMMMHLNMKQFVTCGLAMMKYSNNHSYEFSAPYCAYALGLMQLTGGIFAEISAMIYLSSLDSPIDIIIRFMALSQVADVNGIVYRAIPAENRIFKQIEHLKITVHRRDFVIGKYERDRPQKVLRVIYKGLRILYASFFFYFFPLVIIVMPLLVKGI
jgi:hypothetical protein